MDQPQGPFRSMIVLGDSNAYGMCAHKPDREWPQVVASWLREFQEAEIQVLNKAIPSNVISPRCPIYDISCKPSLMERYRSHCIDLDPDLVIIAQSLNDVRAGMPVQAYMEDLEHIVIDIAQETDACIVLMGVYHQVEGQGYNDPQEYPWAARWDFDILEIYNQAISRVAKRTGALFVDVLKIMGGADWLLNADCVHMNDLGHVLIGNGLFEVLATHVSGLGEVTRRRHAEKGVSVENTGGADASEDIRELWANHSRQNPDLVSK